MLATATLVVSQVTIVHNAQPNRQIGAKCVKRKVSKLTIPRSAPQYRWSAHVAHTFLGHLAADCSANRLLAGIPASQTQDVTCDEAWQLLKDADEAKEFDELKRAILVYAKTAYESENATKVTFGVLEETFREAKMKTYLIAKQQNVASTHDIMNLQGEGGQKYVVSFQLAPKACRAKFQDGWPATPDENMARLSQAGFVVDSMVPKCNNCGGEFPGQIGLYHCRRDVTR